MDTEPKRTNSAKRFWIFSITGMIGILAGLGLYTFSYAEGLSYLSDDPNACINCHVMRDQFEGWNHSSHKEVAACNDCHTPHTFPQKYIIKGGNGWNHSVAFTLGTYPDNIQIRDFNADVVQDNCVYCHKELVSQIYTSPSGEVAECVACHRDVGHK